MRKDSAASLFLSQNSAISFIRFVKGSAKMSMLLCCGRAQRDIFSITRVGNFSSGE